MIDIEKLNFTYPDGTTALKDVSIRLSFENDEHITAIVGKSGSGKTTMLQCLARFLAPRSGRITVDDEDIYTLSEREFRSRLGVVFQDLFLFPHKTVVDNCTLAMVKVQGIDPAKADREARAMLDRVGVGHLADNYPAQLSGGQAQRVAIARALVMKPRYLLLDEPTSALDINTTNAFGELLQELREKTSFIIVTHDIPFVRKVAHRAVLLKSGEVVTHDTVDKVMEEFLEESGEPAAG